MIIEKNKNTFEDLLGLEIETEDKFLNKKLNSNVCYLGGGGGGGQKQQDIAPTLRPFVTDVLERAKAEFTQDELAQFPGERVVGFSDDELAAQEGILGLVDRGISSDKRLSSADTYYDPALGLLRKSGRYTDKGASEITADEIQSRMNPYTQAVLDIAKRKAADEGALYRQQLASQAARTGGFGGSRQAILEAKAASDLGGRLSEIQTKGLEAAYNDAIRAAEAARGRQFQAAQGLGALSGQFGNLGQQALGQAYREQGYRSGVGEAQRGLEQQRADIAYQTFVEGRDFPARQLERYAGIAFGVPQGYLQQPGPASPSAFQQFAGGVTTVGGLGRGLGFFNQGGNIGNTGLTGAIQALSGGQIQALLEQKKQLEAEIKALKPGPRGGTNPASVPLRNQLDKINATLQAESQNLAKPPPTGGRPSPSGSSNIKPAPFQLPPSGLVQTSGSGKQPPPKSQQPPQLSPYEATIQDLGERFGGLGTTEAQKQGLAAYAELAKLIGEDKFDKEAREAEIQEQIEAARSQGGFDIAALGVEIMSKPLAEIDNDLIRNLGTSKKEIAALKAEINKLPAEERAQGIKNALTKITALGSISDLIPDVLEAPDASGSVLLNAIELASQGMGKSFSQNQLENAGIRVGKLATDVLEDIDALQIKDENTRNQAYVEALAQKLRDEMRKKGLLGNVVAGGGSGTGTGGSGGTGSNQGKFIPPPTTP